MKPVRVLDVECFPNFFLVLLKRVDTGELTRFQISPNRRLDVVGLMRIMADSATVGFNSNDYDLPMLRLALTGVGTYELKEASDDLIARDMRRRDFEEKWQPARHVWNHVDLIHVAPGKASLKLYAGRMHCRKLQDLPIDPSTELTAEQAEDVARYCENDLDNTASLYAELRDQIALREKLSREYRQDLRSRSDPQVAEAIIVAEVAKINKTVPQQPRQVDQTFRYKMPSWIKYDHPALRRLRDLLLETDFKVNAKGGVDMPDVLSGLTIRIGGSTYRVGIGGLHSSEVNVAHLADEDTLLVDRDVASYYPSIILTQGLYPKHLGPAFLTVYKDLVDRRLAAKRAKDKDTAESLKVAINGTFGKLGNKFSAIYSPDLMIQITVTGQLALLRLIEMLEARGFDVLSANTDGVLIRCSVERRETMDGVVAEWERVSGFATEETLYSAVYSKDVNNYLAIKADGKGVKAKGLYNNPWDPNNGTPSVFKLAKNPNTTIVTEAVVEHLKNGTPLYYTISRCRDVRKFVFVRTVAGGASQEGEYLGKVVRWYYATKGGGKVINYQRSGYKVPKSDCSKPLMELPEEFPRDVNFDWYVAEAREMLRNIGHAQGRLF